MATLKPQRGSVASMDVTAEESAISRSVLYASLFDYPLTLAELRQTLIESDQTPTQILHTYGSSQTLQTTVEHQRGFFFPRGRENLLYTRRSRERHSRRFLQGHRTLLTIISRLPYVRMVALSGSIAHLNLADDGDLDLFVVARRGHVWSVNVAIILLAKLLGKRRTLCANFVVGDQHLDLQPQDLFTASQIIHLKPLVGREVYNRLLAANPFIYALYPNFHAVGSGELPFDLGPMARGFRWLVERLLALPAALAERCCRHLYRRHLLKGARRWLSPDQVRLEAECLKLHTRSHRWSVIERFNTGGLGS